MSQLEINQSPSEEKVFQARGYKVLEKLGEGSFAKVYLAKYRPDNDSEREVKLACKIVDTTKAPKDFVKKFLPRELNILEQLKHPYLIHVHSIFKRRARYFIFMRFAEKGNLLDYNLKHGPISETQSRIWFRQLALGLQYLHELDIAHRDIKCENVLITEHLNVIITDFGFSRYVVDARGKKILSDTFCGSLMYAAPEILRGSPYNPKLSDTWSLGVILYIMLNKAMPFDETNLKKLYELQTNCRWKFRRKIIDTLSEQVKKVVTNMLLPDCNKRWKIDQIVRCNWIAMDPRLVIMTHVEQAALNHAINEREKKKDHTNNKKSVFHHDAAAEHPAISGFVEAQEVTIIKNPSLRRDTAELISDYSKNITSTIPDIPNYI
ncbi:hypothetical protein HCN44_008750 [Aphidius gifuensis]|uniref:Protein kinase domain-containing protein n=1 Tax=Aphidius gifuensis TaxID=684658 RepID=A0A834XQA3_APHGI|nr:testis-specific serine/threonine-protein kinase 1-like [Aphidius gifuensis]KAF7991438.1 hypothetical protein HCN44_008750 [Aphidius gifuensis]